MNSPANSRPSLLPAILGFLFAGVSILVLGFWVAHRPAPTEPSLELVHPANDTAFSGPVRVRFRSSVPLRLQPTGWGSGKYHPHILLGETEIMAAASSIHAIGDGLYEWTLPPLDQPAVLQLIWALPNHQRLTEGKSKTVRISPAPLR